MSLQIVCCADKMPTYSYLRMDAFLASARRYGYEPIVLGWGQPWGGLSSKPRLLKQAIDNGTVTAEHIIFADAHDVFFAADPGEILMGLHNGWAFDEIVWNAERDCFPNAGLAESFNAVATNKDGSHSPYRYLNSGLSIGLTEAYRECLQEMGADHYLDDHQVDGKWVHRNDQLDWQERFLFGQCEGQVPMALDYECRLFQTMTGAEASHFEFNSRGIKNLIMDTYPMAMHFNGGSKTQGLMEPFLERMGL